MLSFLGDILEVIENLPLYVVYAGEQFINLFFAVIEAALEGAALLLGELPPTIAPPAFVSEINWFYPVGTLLAVVAPLLTAYIIWLGISWLYRKFGAI